MRISIPQNPKQQESKARLVRINERVKNPKANPTNKDIQDQLNDLSALILEGRVTR